MDIRTLSEARIKFSSLINGISEGWVKPAKSLGDAARFLWDALIGFLSFGRNFVRYLNHRHASKSNRRRPRKRRRKQNARKAKQTKPL